MEKDEFSMFLEGNLLEERVGIRMVILVLDSLILWGRIYAIVQATKKYNGPTFI
jgi:hypothetical protein